MRRRRIAVIALVVGGLLVGVGSAIAAHVTQVDPATVPTGFLAAHNQIADIKALKRVVTKHGADVFVQHARLDPNQATGWHTHPGPAIVTVVKGALTYEDAAHKACQQVTYTEGSGFVDQGFGHVHRAIAGASGADFYVTYVLPPGSPNQLIPTDPPKHCVP